MTRVTSDTNHERGIKVQHFHVQTHADWVRSQFIRYFFSVLLNRSRTGGDVSVFGLQSPVILHFVFGVLFAYLLFLFIAFLHLSCSVVYGMSFSLNLIILICMWRSITSLTKASNNYIEHHFQAKYPRRVMELYSDHC